MHKNLPTVEGLKTRFLCSIIADEGTNTTLAGYVKVGGESLPMTADGENELVAPATPAGDYLYELRAGGLVVMWGNLCARPSAFPPEGEYTDIEVSAEMAAEMVIGVQAELRSGPRGEKGERGEEGPRGYSAYEIACQEGFVGTEAEWLEAMRQETATLAVQQVTPLTERAERAATEAGASETQAEKYAADATSKAEEAHGYASTAGESAKNAVDAASTADAARVGAQDAQRDAEIAAEDTEQKAKQAEQSATAARNSAGEAAASAAGAEASKKVATTAATEAASAATNAAGSATAAAESASAAAESAATIEGANETITNHDAHWAAWYRQQTNLTGFLEVTDDNYVLTEFKYDLPNLVTGTHLFKNNRKLEKFSGSLQSLVTGTQMFHYCLELKEFSTDSLDKLTSASEFLYGTKIEEFNYSLPAVTSLWKSFGWTTNLRAFRCGELSNLTSATETFSGVRNLEIFDGTMPALSSGLRMFNSCQLNKESALRVLTSIPAYESGSHPITVGIHVDNKTDEEVLAAIDAASAKGWTVTTQWNGKATASTFALRPAPQPPVYVKRVQDEEGEYADATGTRYTVDWGHSVTSPHGEPEDLGYELFESVEEALEAWGLTVWEPKQQG